MEIPNGWFWNEAELPHGDPLNRGLLSLLVVNNGLVHLVGTAFIVQVEGNRVCAASAAHNFEYIRKILHPENRHHPSALPEFLPVPDAIDLKQVQALYVQGDSISVCTIELAGWDSEVDLALFFARAQEGTTPKFAEFRLDDQLPAIGEKVTMIGFGEMDYTQNANQPAEGTLKRRLMMRIGYVEEIYPERYLLLKTPCIRTSIPVLKGMSGGVVIRGWPPDSRPAPFAFISHSPETDDPQTAYDRSKSGASVGVIMNMAIEPSSEDQSQTIRMTIKNAGVGKTTDLV